MASTGTAPMSAIKTSTLFRALKDSLAIFEWSSKPYATTKPGEEESATFIPVSLEPFSKSINSNIFLGPTNDDLAKILNIPVLEIEAAGINVTHHMINKRSIMPKDMALSAITTEQWAAAANLTVAEYNAYGPLNITRS